MAENDIDFIEVIEPVLDNQQFMLAVIGGVVVGVIAVYGYMEYLKTHPRSMPEPLRMLQSEDEGLAPEPSTPNMGQW